MRGILAGRCTAVMAGTTSTNHLCVIYFTGRFEGRSHMTAFTLSGGSNMREILACCIRTIVTTETVAGNTVMTELRRLPRQ